MFSAPGVGSVSIHAEPIRESDFPFPVSAEYDMLSIVLFSFFILISSAEFPSPLPIELSSTQSITAEKFSVLSWSAIIICVFSWIMYSQAAFPQQIIWSVLRLSESSSPLML